RVGLRTSSVFLTTPDAGAALILFGRADMASPVPDQQECADGHGPARPDYLRTRIAGSSVQRRLVIISCARSWMAAASWLRPTQTASVASDRVGASQSAGVETGRRQHRPIKADCHGFRLGSFKVVLADALFPIPRRAPARHHFHDCPVEAVSRRRLT